MHIKAREAKSALPYMFDYYNVMPFYENPLSQNRNALSCIFNSFMSAINDKKSLLLPRMIILIPDWYILHFINHYSYGVSMMSGKCIDWLLNNMERVIEAKKDHLHCRRVGAVMPNEPKIIWIKMINRSNKQKIPAVRNKFNHALEDLLADRRYHYILDLGKMVEDARNFTYNNLLNARGQDVFWLEIDRLIEHFDYHKEHLRPMKQPAATVVSQQGDIGNNWGHDNTINNQQTQPRVTVYPKNPKYY